MHITYKMITELTNLASLVKAVQKITEDIVPEMWIKYFIIVQYQHLYESVCPNFTLISELCLIFTILEINCAPQMLKTH